MKELLMSSFVNLLNAVVSFNVNSTCFIGLGQPEEPKSLERFKTVK